MSQNLNQLGQEFVELLRQNAIEAGRELTSDLTEVKDYAAARMQHLSTIVGEPGFREALIAERDNVALKAAGRAINRADAFDARILGVVEGALAIGSRALASLIPG